MPDVARRKDLYRLWREGSEPDEPDHAEDTEDDTHPEDTEERPMTMSTFRPIVPRSLTRRRDAVKEAKRKLQRWQHLTTLTKSPDADTTDEEYASDVQASRVSALLWAIAQCERALWLETSGQIGDEIATPRRIMLAAGSWSRPKSESDSPSRV